jgi:hypothetical protein
LFLRFIAQRHHRTVPQLRLEDLTGSEVAAFLQYTEQERRDSIGTRNCRLAALRSLFGFVATESRTPPCNALRFCAFPPRRRRGTLRLIWTRRRWKLVYGSERTRLFDAAAKLLPLFADYQKKTKREIPVLTLTRID